MRRLFLSAILMLAAISQASAIGNNFVEIVYNGSSATVNIASNISSYITNNSNGSHVSLVQSADFQGNTTGEITYILTGSSTDGEFYLEGAYKCTIELDGLTLTNPSGPALNIQNGKRVKISAESGTTNTLTDGVNELYNGCIHCKGHTELKGKGTLNIVGNSRHALYSKEYVEIKNLTLNITAAKKDGIHCQQYFLMESGTVNISGVQDDGIQVELRGTESTGITTDHEDEDTGNFYMAAGKLTISGYSGKAVKADGAITLSGGTVNFNSSAMEEYAGIKSAKADSHSSFKKVCDLSGRALNGRKASGLYIAKKGGQALKVLSK